MSLYRLVYASKAEVAVGEAGINLEIGRVLTKSKRNNPKVNIGGVLYYGNNFFFQILEGDKKSVKALYKKILLDARHSQARVLLEGAISKRRFEHWSMHFIPASSDIQLLLRDYGQKKFNPFEFSTELVEAFLIVLENQGMYERKKFSLRNFLSSFTKTVPKV